MGQGQDQCFAAPHPVPNSQRVVQEYVGVRMGCEKRANTPAAENAAERDFEERGGASARRSFYGVSSARNCRFRRARSPVLSYRSKDEIVPPRGIELRRPK